MGRSTRRPFPAVVATHPPRLARVLNLAQANGAGLVVIDTAPRAGGAVEAARVSDLVLIPCRPSLADLAAVPAALDVARLAGTRAAVVLNAVPARGNLVAEAVEALRELDAELCPVTLGARVAHVRSFTAGRTAQENRAKIPGGRRSRRAVPVDPGGCIMTKRSLADGLRTAAAPQTARADVPPSRRGRQDVSALPGSGTLEALQAGRARARNKHADMGHRGAGGKAVP